MSSSTYTSCIRRGAGALLVPLLLLVALSVPAPASAASGPVLQLNALANSTAAPGAESEYMLGFTNVGDAATNGEPIALDVALPVGITAISATTISEGNFTCTAADGTSPVAGASGVKCVLAETIETYHVSGVAGRAIRLRVQVSGAAAGLLTATITASGGGAGESSRAVPVLVTPAPPAFGIAGFDQQVIDSGGSAFTQASAVPTGITTSIAFETGDNPNPNFGIAYPPEPAKDTVVDLPPGLLGAPNGVERCTVAQLAHHGFQPRPLCPPAAQVGSVQLQALDAARLGPGLNGPLPLYNMVPPAGVPAEFAFNFKGSVITLLPRVRSNGDYGLAVEVLNIPAVAIVATSVTFWGAPASAEHDLERGCPGEVQPEESGATCPGASEPQAFLRDPTSCGGPTTATLHLDSWFHPGAFDSEGEPLASDPNWKTATVLSHEAPGYPLPPEPSTFPAGYTGPTEWGPPVGNTGCEAVPFEPTITARPTTTRADSPTGLDVDVSLPQGCFEPKQTVEEVEEAVCSSDLKNVRVTEPAGVRLNPAAADGLVGCSEAQIGFLGSGFPMPNPTHFTSAPPSCPDASKIGTAEVESPLLADTLKGSVYLARQGENPFGSELALYAVAAADGVTVKLPAELRTDPATGQLTTIFRDNPQLPFSHYRLHLFGGPRAPLITPPTCGPHTTRAAFTGWARPEEEVVSEDPFPVTEGAGGQPCPAGEGARPFAPSFEAGTVNPLAGAFSPLVLKVGREDGSQEIAGIEAALPEGLLAKLAGVPYCPDSAIAAARTASATAEQASPSCPASSQIGVSDAAAGAGPMPFHNSGKVYLAGPYKDAPLSLVSITPVLAGPLDLGPVVVRAALRIDTETTRTTAVSDPLPTILDHGGDGFPLDLRRVLLHLDRPGFTLNPTSCEAMAVAGRLTSAQGATATPASHFQVGNCEALAFKPKLQIALKGKTARAGHPALRATLTMPPGGANIARASVILPHSEFLAQGHLADICTRVQYAAAGGGGAGCPPRSVYGHAVAYTPLLDRPLEGNVYLRSSSHALPDLVASLGGQIHLDLVGRVGADRRTEGLKTTFAAVPDARVTKFILTLPAGRHSLLENSQDICRSAHRAFVHFDAHNGKVAHSRVKVRVAGCRRG